MVNEARKQILVWGADPKGEVPLFKSGEQSGPNAGAFRTVVRDRLHQRLEGRNVKVIFSEQGERFGHHERNPGLYEPKQLDEAICTVLIMPANRPLGVNTWELALACETDRAGHIPRHVERLLFVMPTSLYQFLTELWRHDLEDPADHIWVGGAEPELGQANSFAARWIYLYATPRLKKSGKAGNPGTVDFICHYEDGNPWELDGNYANELVETICHFVDTYHLSNSDV